MVQKTNETCSTYELLGIMYERTTLSTITTLNMSFTLFVILGYRYVANILLGETELDLSVHRRLLQIFTPEIINNLEPSELIDHLYAKEVISQTDKEEIECEKRNRGSCAASLMLLDRIPRRIQNWYNEFVSALRACGFDFVADNIDLPELNQSSCCTGSLTFNLYCDWIFTSYLLFM